MAKKKRVAKKKVTAAARKKKAVPKKKSASKKKRAPASVGERVRKHRNAQRKLGFKTRSFVVHDDDVHLFQSLERKQKEKRNLKEKLGDSQ